MLEEVNVSDEIIDIILSKSFKNSVITKNSDNWLLKILYYSDLRTLPFGIGSLNDRIADVRDRMPQYTTIPDFENLVNACYDIESQIQQSINIPITFITDDSITYNKNELLNIQI